MGPPRKHDARLASQKGHDHGEYRNRGVDRRSSDPDDDEFVVDEEIARLPRERERVCTLPLEAQLGEHPFEFLKVHELHMRGMLAGTELLWSDQDDPSVLLHEWNVIAQQHHELGACHVFGDMREEDGVEPPGGVA